VEYAANEADDGEIEEDTLIISSDNEVLLTKSSDSDTDQCTTLDDVSSSARLLSPKSKKNHLPDSPYSTSSNDSTDGTQFVNITLKQKHIRPKAKKDAKYEKFNSFFLLFFFFNFIFKMIDIFQFDFVI
jgi:hypothetical protein